MARHSEEGEEDDLAFDGKKGLDEEGDEVDDDPWVD